MSDERQANAFMQSFDARDWAKAFVEHVRANPEIATDEGTMIGWFANAIMRGYDEHTERALREAMNSALSSSPLAPTQEGANG